MTVRDQVFQAAEKLADSKPFDLITFAEVAKTAGVHWTAVRRHFGSKQEMRKWLKDKQAASKPEFADTKSRVLDAAAHIFSIKGYMNCSLDQVGEEAGLSKGAVYWHFSSKQDLFLAVLERNYEQQLRMLPNLMERIVTSENPVLTITGWLESEFKCLESGDVRSMLFLDFLVSVRDIQIRERLQKLHANLIDNVAKLFQTLQQKGYLADDVDPRSAALMVDVLLKGVLVEWNLEPNRDALTKLIDTLANMLQGLLVKH